MSKLEAMLHFLASYHNCSGRLLATNGKHWQLYHQNTAHKLEIFYEIDLPDLLLDSAGESFYIFLLFFGEPHLTQAHLL
jgi:hypothetical protein